MPGSVQLTAQGAFAVGTGLVDVITHPSHAASISVNLPEAMYPIVQNAEELKAHLSKASAIVVGPGIANSAWAQMMLEQVFTSNLPIIVDAGALDYIKSHQLSSTQWILTPHAGEAARLLGINPEQLQADRLLSAINIQQQFGGITVLKGHNTLIADANNLFLCPYGNPGMASAGMGDLLVGVIGGLLAQHFDLLKSACLGVCLHSYAGDLAEKHKGMTGMLASELISYIRSLINKNSPK
jgi:NAD(P)H-hydrate epimerase